ncbi:MAG: hypothetical protein ACPIOQ_58520, partial [Promethearchaeia archaeon]
MLSAISSTKEGDTTRQEHAAITKSAEQNAANSPSTPESDSPLSDTHPGSGAKGEQGNMEASEPWGGLEQSIARGSAVEAAAYEFLDQDFQVRFFGVANARERARCTRNVTLAVGQLYANMQQAMDRREK